MRNALKVLFVVALAIPTLATATIASTKHNLTGVANPIHFTDTSADMCKFCHVVHNATVANSVALWARQAPTGLSFVAVNTVAGTVLNTAGNGTLGAGSQKCLSCHDGSVALNTVVNRYGTSLVASNASLVAPAGNTASVGAGIGLTSAARYANLAGQHPVSIPFGGLAAAGSLAPASEYGNVSTTGCATGVQICVLGATNPTAGAKIKLYGAAASATVECGSCHEPHMENVASANPFFLRVSTADGANGRCGACHKK